MKVTEVRLRLVKKDEVREKLRAFADITLDNAFAVHEITIIDGEKGLFVAMPSKKSSDGSFKDIAHPIESSLRREISEKVLSKYHEINNSAVQD